MRIKAGEHFKSSTFTNVRQSLRTILMKEKGCDIIYDPDFRVCNVTFANMLKEIKIYGKGCVTHTAEVNIDDLRSIVASLDENEPQQLQWLVWVFVKLFFAQRANEVVSKLKIADLIFQSETDKEVISLRNFATKNHQKTNEDASIGGRIMSTKSEKCPVRLIKKTVF